jgi:aspyridone synthetase (hybrid polyketide synthase/nonribosomal peptide synthetase)
MPLPEQGQGRKPQSRLDVSEGELHLIWKKVLRESRGAVVISPETDFFTVGGSSLLLLRLQQAINEKMGAALDLRDLY